MEELRELLATLEAEGAPKHILDKLIKVIEARSLRIRRNDTQEFRIFIEKRKEREEKEKESSKNNTFLMMILLILLLTEADDDRDEFNILDILPDTPTKYTKFKQ